MYNVHLLENFCLAIAFWHLLLENKISFSQIQILGDNQNMQCGSADQPPPQNCSDDQHPGDAGLNFFDNLEIFCQRLNSAGWRLFGCNLHKCSLSCASWCLCSTLLSAGSGHSCCHSRWGTLGWPHLEAGKKYRNLEIQNYRSTEVQKYRNTEIQKYRNTAY